MLKQLGEAGGKSHSGLLVAEAASLTSDIVAVTTKGVLFQFHNMDEIGTESLLRGNVADADRPGRGFQG